MTVKYIGNRPVKLRRSKWEERVVDSSLNTLLKKDKPKEKKKKDKEKEKKIKINNNRKKAKEEGEHSGNFYYIVTKFNGRFILVVEVFLIL